MNYILIYNAIINMQKLFHIRDVGELVTAPNSKLQKYKKLGLF